ncbi:hypothetical protein TWF225_005448 [Orbilia oligospora]|nr:hypothetical protein TWF225_005448 [Orbilia oligospora]KAF3250567.1 hypothetical protein TWF128_007423 [Orbilia oligospora]KAF3270772.1 hypothetical protein TWF217_007046 [Orbilia oligospora]
MANRPKVPDFAGPLTVPIFINWLRRCNYAFDQYPDYISDSLRVEITGDAILRTSSTRDIYTWWITDSASLIETKGWDSFQDLIKKEALGAKWEINILKDYFSIQQRDQTVEEYEKGVEHLARLVGFLGGWGTDGMKGFIEKCFLLFGAREEVRERVLEEKVKCYRSIVEARREDVVSWLKKYDGEEKARKDDIQGGGPNKTTPLPEKKKTPDVKSEKDPSPVFGSFPILYVVGQCSPKVQYTYAQKHFNDLSHLPNNRFPISNMTALTLYAYTTPTTFFDAYEFLWSNQTPLHFDGRVRTDQQHLFVKREIPFDIDEYIVGYQIEFCDKLKDREIRDVEIQTSKGKEWKISKDLFDIEPNLTVKAPDGWAIVGFYGTYDDRDWGWPIRTIGPVFGRLSADRTEVGR